MRSKKEETKVEEKKEEVKKEEPKKEEKKGGSKVKEDKKPEAKKDEKKGGSKVKEEKKEEAKLSKQESKNENKAKKEEELKKQNSKTETPKKKEEELSWRVAKLPYDPIEATITQRLEQIFTKVDIKKDVQEMILEANKGLALAAAIKRDSEVPVSPRALSYDEKLKVDEALSNWGGSRTELIKEKKKTCGCESDCSSKKCKCFKSKESCDQSCGCSKYLCLNRSVTNEEKK